MRSKFPLLLANMYIFKGKLILHLCLGVSHLELFSLQNHYFQKTKQKLHSYCFLFILLLNFMQIHLGHIF